MDARSGAGSRWYPRVPHPIDNFGLGESSVTFVYYRAVRLVDRRTGKHVRWTQHLRRDILVAPFVEIGGGRVLVYYLE